MSEEKIPYDPFETMTGDDFIEALNPKNWEEVQRLHTPTFEAILQDGYLTFLFPDGQRKQFERSDVEALTHFLDQYAHVEPLAVPTEDPFEGFEPIKVELAHMDVDVPDQEPREPGLHPEVVDIVDPKEDKLEYIRVGDYLKIQVQGKERTVGPVSFYETQNKTIILVPDQKGGTISVQQHAILGIISNGVETIRFKKASETPVEFAPPEASGSHSPERSHYDVFHEDL